MGKVRSATRHRFRFDGVLMAYDENGQADLQFLNEKYFRAGYARYLNNYTRPIAEYMLSMRE